jgi:oxygen-independent coproporphyrinogen-3 oxidase
MSAVPGGPPLAVYVHWPFCLSKCPYCDFNSHVADAVEPARWRAALLAELAFHAERTPGRTVSSLFFGGGTPSLMEPACAGAVIDALRRHWRAADDLEITLEANPTSVEASRFADFAAAGVNRVSIGVQSLDDAVLRALGRGHTGAQARRAVETASRLFGRLSVDLLYALPGQGEAAWRADLAAAAELAPCHLSAYQLTITPGTEFHRRGVAAADEDTAAILFEAACEVLAGHGLARYEVSNHAVAGEECRHNLAIWRGDDYVGVGPGAHGRVHLGARWEEMRAVAAPGAWLAMVEARGHGVQHRVGLAPGARADELLLMGLRLDEGIARARFAAAAGLDFDAATDGERLADLVAGGFLTDDGAAVRATPAGLLRLDSVIAALTRAA